MKRPRALPATMALVAVAVSAVAVGRTLDRGSSGDEGHDPQIREELLQDVQPNPDCPNAEESPTPRDGEVLVNVVRVVDGCLAYSSEVVAQGEVEDRLDERRAELDVVAADEAVEYWPGSVAGPEGGRRGGAPEQWALAPEHLDGERIRSLWPADAPEVKVAVIDTGIDGEHLDLADQIAEQAPWVHRYEGEADQHGTHVAGVVAAADDDAGVIGLTPAARLMDVQYSDGDDYFAGPSDDLGDYVRWAVDHGADVINMSIQGRDPSDTLLTAILYAELRGVVVVGISGNCGGENAGQDSWWLPPSHRDRNPCERRHETKYPAGYDTVLGVANHTRDGQRWETSSANASVDIAAPGTEILSTCLTEGSDTRRTCDHTGTSQAAPFVSATAALLLARHPDASPAAIREAITEAARTPDGQPADRRTDEFGWGLLDPSAAAEYLDEHPGRPQTPESPTAERTHAAFKANEDGRLYALDDGILHPVHEVGPTTSVTSVDWSADRSQLVATADDSVFLWNGPGSTLDSEVFEAPCDHCEAAFLERASGSELVAAIGNDHEIVHFDPDTLGQGGTVPLALPAPDNSSTLHGDVNGHLVVSHSPDSESSGLDTLWLVDPLTGEDVAQHARDGNVAAGAVAIDADGEQIAYVGGQRGGPCGHTDEVYLLNGGDLTEVSNPDLPTSDLGDLIVDDLFFNGDALYATMTATRAGAGGEYCTHVGSAGLWRLDDDGEIWQQIDPRPVQAVRPVEGMTEDPHSGRITIAEDRHGTFEPTGAPSADTLDLGSNLSGLHATPTRTEVDLSDTTSPPPITNPPSEGEEGAPAPNTTEGAIARFEQYLQALGEGDVDTLCEIAGPAAQVAEENGFGPCTSTYGAVVEMITAEQAEDLRTATVDPDLVDTTTPGEVYIPFEAVVSSGTFTEDDLGSYRLAYQDGNWFIVG